MTEDVISSLPEVFRNHLCTVKKASFDETNRNYMSESLMEVVDFDKLPKIYARGRGWPAVPNSNDALYISEDKSWYFVEFKNGSIDRADIYRKAYDSLIMLIEMEIIPDIEFIRRNISYILVYNSEKYGKLQKSESRDQNYRFIMRLAGEEEKLFGIEKLEHYLFRAAHTYTKELFQEKFVVPMEAQEKGVLH